MASTLPLVLLFCSILAGFAFSQQVPAMFVFGDSLVDVGNNNVLPTPSRANHLPYGIDFSGRGPTGRFSNGRLVVDFIASYLGLPFLPPYHLAGFNILNGVNFGSASSGVLPYTHMRGAEPLMVQLNNFQNVHRALTQRLGVQGAQRHLNNSIFYICIGNNDINNQFNSFSRQVPSEFIDTVIETLVGQIQRLYTLGARKFVIQGLSAVGCIPMNQVKGKCSAVAQAAAAEYNVRLWAEIQSLRESLTHSYFIMPNFYDLMVDVHDHPEAYGFEDAVFACCAMGSSVLQCNPGVRICPDRSLYTFWDAVHQTEAFNSIAASRWWAGNSSDVVPMTIRDLVAI